jgi:hypothetical protein
MGIPHDVYIVSLHRRASQHRQYSLVRRKELFRKKRERGLGDLQEAWRRAGRSRRGDKILDRRRVVPPRQHPGEERER